MKPAGGEQVGRLLAVMVLQGLLTLEQLDHPSTGWQQIEADRAAANSRAKRLGIPQPYPLPPQWRNLAREWIAANPTAWQALLTQHLEAEARSVATANPIEQFAA